jgi:DNA-binding IclR family transcriptional regulator
MAAPVLGANGVAIAALSISGPTVRLSARINELAEHLKAEANSLSLQLRGAA